MPLLFVYGTLRSNDVNHELLGDAELINAQAKTAPSYQLAGDEYGYFGLQRGKLPIDGELYNVPYETLQQLDQFEKPFERTLIWLDRGQLVFAYTMPKVREMKLAEQMITRLTEAPSSIAKAQSLLMELQVALDALARTAADADQFEAVKTLRDMKDEVQDMSHKLLNVKNKLGK